MERIEFSFHVERRVQSARGSLDRVALCTSLCAPTLQDTGRVFRKD